MWRDGGREVVPAPSRNSDSVWVEVSVHQGPDEGNKVGTSHQEVAGEDLAEALFEISLNESNEGCRHVLLDRCLCLEALFNFVCCFLERFELEHKWVVLLWSQ